MIEAQIAFVAFDILMVYVSIFATYVLILNLRERVKWATIWGESRTVAFVFGLTTLVSVSLALYAITLWLILATLHDVFGLLR